MLIYFRMYNYHFQFSSTGTFGVSLKLYLFKLRHQEYDQILLGGWRSNLSPSGFRSRWFRPRQFFRSGDLSVPWGSLCRGGGQRSSGEDIHPQHLPTGTMNGLVNLLLKFYMYLVNITCCCILSSFIQVLLL